jgi:tryptophan-rich hypothetical protein
MNAQWTRQESTLGWRHFRISGVRHSNSGRELELMAVCDRRARFWLMESELKNGEIWAPGWIDLAKL